MIRRFTMFRRSVPDATHNALQKNAPDKPQFEGVVWTDGTCTIRWMTAKGSTAVWSCFDDMMAIHGHPEYGSEIIWHDAANEPAAEVDAMTVSPFRSIDYIKTQEELDAYASAVEEATIERCAQVCDELANYEMMPANKAAAYENAAVHIRALKDKAMTIIYCGQRASC